MKWISTEARPLITKQGNRWQTTEDGSGDFLAALEVYDSEDNSTGWWIRHCRIEDEIGLVVVCDDETEPAGWEIEDIEYFIPIKDPHEESNVSSQEPDDQSKEIVDAIMNCQLLEFDKPFTEDQKQKMLNFIIETFLMKPLIWYYYQFELERGIELMIKNEADNNKEFILSFKTVKEWMKHTSMLDALQNPQEPDATASKEIGEPLVQNKSNQ